MDSILKYRYMVRSPQLPRWREIVGSAKDFLLFMAYSERWGLGAALGVVSSVRRIANTQIHCYRALGVP